MEIRDNGGEVGQVKEELERSRARLHDGNMAVQPSGKLIFDSNPSLSTFLDLHSQIDR